MFFKMLLFYIFHQVQYYYYLTLFFIEPMRLKRQNRPCDQHTHSVTPKIRAIQHISSIYREREANKTAGKKTTTSCAHAEQVLMIQAEHHQPSQQHVFVNAPALPRNLLFANTHTQTNTHKHGLTLLCICSFWQPHTHRTSSSSVFINIREAYLWTRKTLYSHIGKTRAFIEQIVVDYNIFECVFVFVYVRASTIQNSQNLNIYKQFILKTSMELPELRWFCVVILRMNIGGKRSFFCFLGLRFNYKCVYIYIFEWINKQTELVSGR